MVSGQASTYIDFGVIRQSCEDIVQCFMHFLCIALKEPTTSTDEQCVASENGSVVPIFHVITDGILGVTWRVKSSHFDVFADLERGIVRWCLGHPVTIFATNDWNRIFFELVIARLVIHASCYHEKRKAYEFAVTSSMVSMATRVSTAYYEKWLIYHTGAY